MAIIEKHDVAEYVLKWINTKRETATETEFSDYLNRSARGLTYLDETATLRAHELVERFDQYRPDGSLWTSAIDYTRLCARYGDVPWAEYRAKGTEKSITEVIEAGLNSSYFYNSDYIYMGCGAVYDEETGETYYCVHLVGLNTNSRPTGENAYATQYVVRPYSADITVRCVDKVTGAIVSDVTLVLYILNTKRYLYSSLKIDGTYPINSGQKKTNVLFTSDTEPLALERLIGGEYRLKASISTGKGYLPLDYLEIFYVSADGNTNSPEMTIELTPYMVTVESYGVDDNSAQTPISGAQYELTFLGEDTFGNAVCDGTDVLISEKSIRFTADTLTNAMRLPIGDYKLIELEPPEDHKKVQEITFSIGSTGKITNVTNAILVDSNKIKVVHSRNPPVLHPLERNNVIKVYDLSYRQEDFGNGNNGLAILHPSECTSTKNADVWNISLVHPLDEWGKWKNLLPEKVLEVRGQLFRINSQTIKCDENGDFITVHARHISGDMADDLIENATFEGGTAQNFIDFAFSTAVMPFDEDYYKEHPDDYYHKPYVFTGYSDIETFLEGCDYTNTSLWGAIVGVDNCLISRYGGELYRNNFYFSVCKRMENACDDAFVIRFSDVSGVSQSIDYTDFCTNLNCYDNFGNSFSVSYTGSSRDIIHHARRKMYKFNYKDESTAFTQLGIDGMALWEKISTPKVSYTVNFCSAKSDPRFADFDVLQDFDYGDKGKIYCPELSIDTEQQIVEVVTNELTGEIISMRLGNVADSLVRPTFLGSTITTGRGISDNLDNRISKLENR